MPRRTRSDVERLVAAERAARVAGRSAAEWWREITRSAASARTDRALDDLFRKALATIRDALDADAVSVLVANEAADQLVARASIGLNEEVTVDLAIHKGEGLAGRVLDSGDPLIVHDLTKFDVVSPVLRNSGLRSVAAVPISFDDMPLGVLYAGSKRFRNFDQIDIELMEVLASRLADALERVRAFETERARRERAERDADHLVRVQDITSKLLRATSKDEVASLLTESLSADALGEGPVWSAVWLRRDENLVMSQTPRKPPATDVPLEVSMDSEGSIAAAARDKRARYTTGADLFAPDEQGSVERFSLSSCAVVPLIVGHDCLGVLAVAHRETHGFEPDERDFLAAMADQAALAIERARLYAAQVTLSEANAFFAQAARVVAEGSDYTDTLGRLASLALQVVGDICLVDVITEDGGNRRMVALHRDPSLQHLVDGLRSDYSPDPLGSHPAIEVIRTGKTRWSEEMSDDFLRETTRDQSHFDLVKSLNFRSYVAVPLMGDSEVIGALTLVSSSRAVGPGDVSFAERFAEHVAAVVDNARRYESTMETSHVLQESLLPRRLRPVPGLGVHTRYLPATRSLEVGGDFYDLISLPGGHAFFMIGDVAGHDRSAAAQMGQLRSAARALASQVDTPSELVAALRQSWQLLDFDRIATGLFCRLDPRTGELMVASAGHYPPLLLEEGSARFVPVIPSEPLGVSSSGTLDWRGRLEEGQVLVLFTDGAIDERDAGPASSMEHLARDLANCDLCNLSGVCDRIVATLPLDRIDDVAMLVVRLQRNLQ